MATSEPVSTRTLVVVAARPVSPVSTSIASSTDDTGVKTGTQDSSKTTISSEQDGVNPVTFVPSGISATGAFGSPPPFLNRQWSARPRRQA